MGKLEKLLKRLQSRPTDFTWKELATLTSLLGYELQKSGKTSGSRRRFVHPNRKPIIIHEPHPNKEFKVYQITQLLEQMKMEGIL